MPQLLFIFGTRPEAIKFAPLIREFQKYPDFKIKVCVTAQHREMLDQVLDFFRIKPNYDLDLMKPAQSLSEITAEAIAALEKVLNKDKPDLVLVQGDTSTAFCGALAAYYQKIQVAHLEAGLRSYNRYSPYPEELNRVLVSRLADYHFAPTETARLNLRREGIIKNVFVTGNSVIDALLLALKEIHGSTEKKYLKKYKWLDKSKKLILVTGHRRESFGKPFQHICAALKELGRKFPVEIIYPVHLNPHIRRPVYTMLQRQKNIHLLEPLAYPELIWLMSKAYLVLTDSGGIQEEAPSLHKPVLVMREVTERSEGVKAGTACLVGASQTKIVSQTKRLLTDPRRYAKMTRVANPYGDGQACSRIVKILRSKLCQ